MRRLLSVIGLVAIAGCVTPSIPIPPPDPAKMSFSLSGTGADTQAQFSYEPEINYVGSIVFVYNRIQGVGIIEEAHPDGSVGPTRGLPAQIGDEIVVTFQRDDQTASKCIRLREGPQSATDFCGP